MQILSWLVLSVFSVFPVVSDAQIVSGSSWSEVQKSGSGTLKVLYLEEPAFAFTDSEGQLTGVEIEIFRQVVNYIQKSRAVTLNVEFVKYDDFSKLYKAVKSASGGVIGLGNFTITADRKKEIAFSPTYLTNIAVLVTHSDVETLPAMSALSKHFEGFSGLVYKGTTHEDRMRAIRRTVFGNLPLVEVNSDAEAIDKLTKDKKLFAYTDMSIYWLASKAGKQIKRHPVGDEASEEFGFILPFGSDWEPVIKDFFQLGTGGYRGSPAYGRILKKHLGEEVTKMMELTTKKTQGK